MNSKENIVLNGVYKHYKGKKYKLLNIIRHSETLEELVMYEALYKNDLGQLWVRPKNMFFEILGDGSLRFELIENPSNNQNI